MDKINIDGEAFEIVPITLASTIPDDEENVRALIEVLWERLERCGLIEVDREQTEWAEVSRYTVLVLKKVNRGGGERGE